MNARQFWDLESVTDSELQIALAQLLASGSCIEARIIAYLAAVEDRRLHLRSGSPSLFDYCIHRLGLSNSEAFHRITAARLARKYPVIFTLVEQRELHLSAVCLLRDYLTPDNHAELLTEASRKTKWQIQELLARKFPKPDVASTMRKLPAAKPHVPRLAVESVAKGTVESVANAPSDLFAGEVGVRLPAPRQATPRSQLEPVSEARYRLQLNVSASLREKLELARALLSHAVPSGDYATLVERALDELLKKARKQRFAQTKCARSAAAAAARAPRKASIVLRGKSTRREHVPNAMRRELVERDGLQCTFIGEDGCRCSANSFLQIHHEEPWARGGQSTLGNLRLLCAAHNCLLAERDFGRELIQARREARQDGAQLRLLATDTEECR